MGLKFTPPPSAHRYAVFLGSHDLKSGHFQTYGTIAAAKQFFRRQRYVSANSARLLERVGDQWFVLYDIPVEALKKPELLPWMKPHRYIADHKVSKTMTREEYAEWRVAVDREQRTTKNWLENITLIK